MCYFTLHMTWEIPALSWVGGHTTGTKTENLSELETVTSLNHGIPWNQQPNHEYCWHFGYWRFSCTWDWAVSCLSLCFAFRWNFSSWRLISALSTTVETSCGHRLCLSACILESVSQRFHALSIPGNEFSLLSRHRRCHPSLSLHMLSFFFFNSLYESGLAWPLFFTIETDITDQVSQAQAQQTETK